MLLYNGRRETECCLCLPTNGQQLVPPPMRMLLGGSILRIAAWHAHRSLMAGLQGARKAQ